MLSEPQRGTACGNACAGDGRPGTRQGPDRCASGVSAGGWWARATPGGIPGGILRQSRVVHKYWAPHPDKAVDVPVTMLHKFQESVPQIQFIDRVLDIPVMSQRQVRMVLNYAENGRLHSAVLG